MFSFRKSCRQLLSLDCNSRRAGFVFVAGLALLAHAGTLANGFVFDDRGAVLENTVVHAPLNVHTLLSTDYWGGRPPGWRVGIWRPVATLTFWTDQRLGGGSPWMFHLTNLLFHMASTLALTFAVLRQSGRPRLAIITGAVFAVLAVNSEAVAGIVSRADVMAAGFTFLAWASVAPVDTPLTGAQLAAFGVTLLAALLCKEAAVAIAAGIVAGCAALSVSEPRQRGSTAIVQLVLATGAVLVFYLTLRQTFVGPVWTIKRDFLNNPLLQEPFVPRVWTGLTIFALIIERSVFPLRLIPDYSFAEITAIRTPMQPAVILALGLLLALLVSAWCLRRHAPMWVIGVAMLLVAWMALSNIPMPLPIVFAERLIYGTSAAAALLFAVAVDRLWDRRRAASLSLLLIVISGNVVRTVVRDRDWHDELRLFSRATEDAPRTARAWNNFGAALMQDGQPAEALDAINRAISIAPDWSPPYTLAGITLATLGRAREAESSLRRSYAIDRNNAQAAYNLAVLLVRSNRNAEASAVLRDFLSAHPDAVRERDLLRDLTQRE